MSLALSRPHLYWPSVAPLREAQFFREELHSGRQPSAPDVFPCWLIYHLSEALGSCIRPCVFLLFVCCLCSSRETNSYLCWGNVLLTKTALSSLVPNLRRLCVTRHRSVVCVRVLSSSSFLFPSWKFVSLSKFWALSLFLLQLMWCT